MVAGTVENQGDFYDRFDHIVLLSAPLDVLLSRVSARTTNAYGRDVVDAVEVLLQQTPPDRHHGSD